MDKIRKGKEGEKKALEYLLNQGFYILEKNFRNANGEIDIIAKKEETIYFIEVKHWKKKEPFSLEVFTQRKINKMKKLAEYYFWSTNQKENHYYVSFALIFVTKNNLEFFFDLF